MEKNFDFQNLDVKLYLALKNMLPHWKAMSEQEAIEGGVKYDPADDAELVAAKLAMEEFELSFGPLPEWTCGRNFGYELVEGAQLCTRDGRKHGNGWIVKITDELDVNIATRVNPYGEFKLYRCLTDAGSPMVLNQKDLESCFTVGDWICTRERILKDFDRHGHFNEQPEG